MKQIKNFEALLKCGFEWDEENQNYVYLYNGNDFIEVLLYGECYYKAHEFGYDFNFEEFNEYNNLLIEMTKAGCFDEPVKTLSELGWELMYNQEGLKLFDKMVDILVFEDGDYKHKKELIRLSIWENDYYNFTCGERFLRIDNELHKAIMLEMEGFNNE